MWHAHRKYDAMFRAYKCVIKQTISGLNFIILYLYHFQVRIIVFHNFIYDKGHILVFYT